MQQRFRQRRPTAAHSLRRALAGCLVVVGVVWLAAPAPAHEGDLQRLFAHGQPHPFVGGQPVKIEGELQVIHGDDFTGPKSFIRYFVRSFATHELMELGFDVPPTQELLTGQAVSVRGRQQNHVVWVNDVVPLSTSGSSGSTSGTLATIPVLTERSAIAILINLTDAALCADVTTCTYSPAYIAGKMFTDPQSVRALYLNSSYQQVTFKTDTNNDGIPDVAGPFTLNYSKVGCSWSTWGAAADSAATAAGINLSLYQHKVYVISSATQTDCGWAGLAYVGGNQAYVSEPQSMMVFAHELGHNVNMAHAGTDPENDNVMNAEYGDSSDPMGSSRAVHNFNGPHAHQMGWLNAFTNAVQSVTASGTYSLAPLGNTAPDGSTPQVLRIAKPSTGDYYYLSYRQPTGFDTTLGTTYTQGVNVHHYQGSGYAFTYFITSLPDNGLFSDTVNGISITQSTHGTGAAALQVTFGCVANTPTVSLSPSSVWVKSGGTTSFTAQITNRDSAGCTGTSFALTGSSTTGSLQSIMPATTSALASGGSTSATISVSAGTSAGTVTVTATDTDGQEPTHTQSGQATATINVDATAPTTPSGLSATAVTTGGKTGVRLTWGSSTDTQSGLNSYYVYRNGAKLGSTTSTSYTDTTGTAGTNYTYGVSAVDRVGNESGMSTTVQFTFLAKRK